LGKEVFSHLSQRLEVGFGDNVTGKLKDLTHRLPFNGFLRKGIFRPGISRDARSYFWTWLSRKLVRGITTMTMFMVRPELHRANEADYQKLHPLMAARGMLRQIVADDGRKYWLPPAEYVTVTDMSRAQVLAAAKACAAAVVPSYAVVVTEATGVMWDGLPPA
jgi:hypothetical protein